jgi:hypothetical protein
LEQYGILDGYEERLGEDDKGGSRAVPSRTSLGCEAAFIKEFPCYGDTRRFFFGLIEERNWTYRCVLTMPQIELMQSDLPHTLYNHDPKDKKDTKVYSQSDIDEATRLCEESLKRSRERRAKRQQTEGYTLDEIFNGEADK